MAKENDYQAERTIDLSDKVMVRIGPETSDDTIIINVYNKPNNPRENKLSGLKRNFKLIKGFVKKVREHLQQEFDRISTPEDNLASVYVDQNGFEYQYGYLPELDKTVAYAKFYDSDGKLVNGIFLDEEMTLVQIDNKVYKIGEQGELLEEPTMDYIGPRR